MAQKKTSSSKSQAVKQRKSGSRNVAQPKKTLSSKKTAQAEKSNTKRKPFGGKGGRKPKKAQIDAEQQKALDEIKAEEEAFDESVSRQVEKTPLDAPASIIEQASTSFFYSSEKFMTQFEDDEILERIRDSYPKFNSEIYGEQCVKKSIIQMLQHKYFIDELLEYYNMTVMDLFKFLYRKEPSIFRGQFISRIQDAIKNKKYADSGRRKENR